MISATKLLQQREEHYQKAKAAHALAVADDTADDERQQYLDECDQHIAEGDALEEPIASAEKRESRINELATNGQKKKELNVDEGKSERRVTIPAQAKRYIARNFIREEREGMTAEERAYAFGRCMLAVAAKTLPGKYDHHFKFVRSHEECFGSLYHTTQAEGPMAAAKEGGNAGIWVPEEFGTDLVVLMQRYGVVRNLFNVLTMTSDKRTDPKEGSDPTPVFVGEGVEGTDITPTDDSTVTLTARKLMGILLWSSELAEDSIAEFGDSMLRRMANGFANKEDDCGLGAGDGTSTYGGMKSIRTKLQDFDGAGTDSVGLVTGTGNLWSQLTLTDFEQVVALLPDFAESAEDAAVWVTHRTFYYQTMVRLELTQGGSTGTEVRDGMRTPIFMGWPVVFSNVFPKTEANSQVVCTFGNHRLAANFGDRRAYSVSFSDQATVGSVNLFSSDQVAVKATERFDIAVHSVGNATDAGPVVGLQTAAS